MMNNNTLTKNNELKDFRSASDFYICKMPGISQNTRKERRIESSYSSNAPTKVYLSGVKRGGPFDRQIIEDKGKYVVRVRKNTINYDSDKIKEYFTCTPLERKEKRAEYLNYIRSTEDVFQVLQLGNRKEEFYDAYDGAVNLLAECEGGVLIEAFDFAQKHYVSKDTEKLAEGWEKNWDILILSLTCSLNIECHTKLTRILSLYDGLNKLSRLIKLALIDAIVDIEIDEELSQSLLNLFTSQKRESEEFIRQYATEAIESL